jgi:alkanesulfonate monooxygenase SsuD/methylene tetrahydromethanopterin reductase-like flavin-dependent oxidoreductase (luciferase family)
MIYVADDDATARAEVEPLVESYIAAANYSRSADRAESAVAGARKPEQEAGMVHEMDDYLNRAVIYGGPQRVAEQLAEYEAIGLGHMMLWFSWGFMDHSVVSRSMQIFVDCVVPAYRELTRNRIGVATP